MHGLRTIVAAAWLAAAPVVVVAQAAPNPLDRIDRELNGLCERLNKVTGADADAVRSRMAALWRNRVAALAALPRAQADTVSRASGISERCLSLAKQAAGQTQPANRTVRHHKKIMKKAAKKKRAGGGGVTMKETIGVPASAGVSRPNGNIEKSSRAPASFARPREVNPGIAADTLARIAPSSSSSGEIIPQAAPAAKPVLQEFFPWPPPPPSDRRLLKLSQLGGDTPLTTWGDVADRLIALLRGAHYTTWGVYSAPGGFAVIPHIEQLDEQTGVALAGAGRWATEVKLASLNFFQRIATVQLPKGAYRSLVFVLSSDTRNSGEITDPKRALERAKRWATSGAHVLPQE